MAHEMEVKKVRNALAVWDTEVAYIERLHKFIAELQTPVNETLTLGYVGNSTTLYVPPALVSKITERAIDAAFHEVGEAQKRMKALNIPQSPSCD